MSNMFTPNTTVVPNANDTSKLDEMIALLQNNLNNAMKAQQFKNSQTTFNQGQQKFEQYQSNLKAENETKLKLLQEPSTMFPHVTLDDVKKIDPSLPLANIMQLLGTTQNNREQQYKELQDMYEKGVAEKKNEVSYDYLYNVYGKNPALKQLLDDNKKANESAKIALNDIQSAKKEALTQARADANRTKDTEALMLVGQAEDINWKNLIKEKGVTIKGYRVKKSSGTDLSPAFETKTITNGVIIKKQDNNYWAYDEGKWKQLQVTTKGNLKTKNFNIDGKNILDPYIREALDTAQSKWEGINIGAKGRETGFEDRFNK